MIEPIMLKTKTILFAEDDEIILKNTTDTLNTIFKQVITAKDGQEGFEKYNLEKPDIILTDIKMPNMDGLEFIQEVRKNDSITPIILFTAHNEQKYLMKAINLQVDVMLVNPAKFEDLLIILIKSMKRSLHANPAVIEFGNNIIYNMSTNELTKEGQKISLSGKEYALMKLLVSKYPNLLSKEEASEKIWPMCEIGETTIKNVISRLREKVGHKHIISITGIGWRLDIA